MREYFREAEGAIFVYDITDQESFANLKEHWLYQFDRFCEDNFPRDPQGGITKPARIVVGNKSDLAV